MIPPSLLYLRVDRFGLWLPLFLVWPLLIVAAPFVFAFGLLTLHPFAALAVFYELFCSLRGLIIDVNEVQIRVR